ncbi:hypothetical protein DC74_1095 [Streptomyces noursei]|nr:hypothetical protein DC74_1095 [Streptomyces noursei]
MDYPRRVIMPRVLRRSVWRTVTREVLFGGNRETWTGWLSREHPAWWAWSQHGTRLADEAGRPQRSVARGGTLRPRCLVALRQRSGARRCVPGSAVRMLRPCQRAVFRAARAPAVSAAVAIGPLSRRAGPHG